MVLVEEGIEPAPKEAARTRADKRRAEPTGARPAGAAGGAKEAAVSYQLAISLYIKQNPKIY
jgi:hypothetical protein